MAAARSRGHGHVARFLEQMGVPRSSAYRWELKVRWFLEYGPAELRRLQHEGDELRAELWRLLEREARVGPMGPDQERAVILLLAVSGTSDEQIAAVLERLDGRRRSHETIRATVNEAAALARVAFGRWFSGTGEVAAVDEIFLGDSPLLLAVEPLSLFISGLRLAEGRTADHWQPVFAELGELARCLADGARGIAKASAEAGVPIQGDMYHLLRGPRAIVEAYWRRCDSLWVAELKAQRDYQAIRYTHSKKKTSSARQRYYRAREACTRALEDCCRLDDLFRQVEGAFDYTTPDRKLNTSARAKRLVAEAIEALQRPPGSRRGKPTPQAQRLAGEFAKILRAPAFAFLDVLEAGLSALRLEQVGPNRQRALARMVADALAWRAVYKDPVAELEAASDGSLRDQVEITVLKVVDRAQRSSSYVECVNARIRTVQVARKRLSEDFVYLVAVYHNLKAFGRGSIREGRSPAELAGIELPTTDWIELLDVTAEELAKAA
jgi:hypothetical protein